MITAKEARKKVMDNLNCEDELDESYIWQYQEKVNNAELECL